MNLDPKIRKIKKLTSNIDWSLLFVVITLPTTKMKCRLLTVLLSFSFKKSRVEVTEYYLLLYGNGIVKTIIRTVAAAFSEKRRPSQVSLWTRIQRLLLKWADPQNLIWKCSDFTWNQIEPKLISRKILSIFDSLRFTQIINTLKTVFSVTVDRS